MIASELYPALRRYRAYLAGEYLPAARQTTAVAALPAGATCYRAAARSFSTLDLDPREVHQIGLREMARIDVQAMQRIAGEEQVKAHLRRLHEHKT